MYNYFSLCTLLHDILSTNSVVIVILSCLESQIRYGLSILSLLAYLQMRHGLFLPLFHPFTNAAGFVISVPFTDIARFVVPPSVPFTNPAPFFNLSIPNLFFLLPYLQIRHRFSIPPQLQIHSSIPFTYIARFVVPLLSHLQMRQFFSFTNTARFVVPPSLLIYKCGTIYLQICSSGIIYY